MALTPQQQAKFNELKDLIAAFEKEVKESYFLMSTTGSFFQEQFEKINKKLAEVEEA